MDEKGKYYRKLKYIKYDFDSPVNLMLDDNGQITGKGFVMAMIVYLASLILPIVFFPTFMIFDIWMVVFYTFYIIIIREMILAGKLKAYYRRFNSFDGVIVYLYNAILPMCILRASWIGLTLVYNIIFKYTAIAQFTTDILDILNPFRIELVLAFSISLIAFYKAYFEDKYTTPEEYTNGIGYREYNLGMNRLQAHNSFCLDKDKEYGLYDYHKAKGYKYSKTNAKTSYSKTTLRTNQLRDEDGSTILPSKGDNTDGSLRRTGRRRGERDD